MRGIRELGMLEIVFTRKECRRRPYTAALLGRVADIRCLTLRKLSNDRTMVFVCFRDTNCTPRIELEPVRR